MAARRPVMASLVIDGLDDLERALEGLNAEDAGRTVAKVGSAGWTAGHIGQHIDSWVNVALGGDPRNQYLSGTDFNFGSTGTAEDWIAIRLALTDVFRRARTILATVDPADVDKGVLYEGGALGLRGHSPTGHYKLGRLLAHIYYHIGDITAI